MARNRADAQPHRRDDGYSLTELLIAMMIFGIIMSVTFGILIQIMNQSKDSLGRTRTLEEVRLGVAQIDRQVRSGNVILDPALEDDATSGVGPFFSMRIYTQVDEIPWCVQWRVIDLDEDKFGDLQFRRWKPGYPNVILVEPWSVVAHNLVEMDVDPPETTSDITSDPSTWPPFWVDNADDAGTVAQSVRITLRLKDPDERASSSATSITTVITGRNTVFGYPADSCAVAPPP